MSKISISPILSIAKDIKLIQSYGLVRGRLAYLDMTTEGLSLEIENQFNMLEAMKQSKDAAIPPQELEQLILLCLEALVFRMLSQATFLKIVTIFKLALDLYKEFKKLNPKHVPIAPNSNDSLGVLIGAVVTRITQNILKVATSSDFETLLKYWTMIDHPVGTSFLAHTLARASHSNVDLKDPLMKMTRDIPISSITRILPISLRVK